MPTMTLNDVAIRALSQPNKGQVTYWDTALSGFGVRVSPGGTKAFVLVHGENRRRVTIGRYPTVSLKNARAEAKRLLAQRTLGLEDARRSVTFDETMEQFLTTSRQKNRPGTTAYYQDRLNRYFKFGKKPLAEITRSDLTSRITRIKTSPTERNHAFYAIRTLMNWAAREELIGKNPLAGMRAPHPVKFRERVLSESELTTIWQAAQAYPYPYGPIVCLLLLTGQRRGEVAALRWNWIDEAERTITLPADQTKNHRAHTFPYGDAVAIILSKIPRFADDDLLFPSRTAGGTVFSGWSKCKARFDADLVGVEPYTLHDLRRTFASTLARLGTPIHVTEKLLNHVSGTISGVAAVYNRHSYIEEMRLSVSTYEQELSTLANTSDDRLQPAIHRGDECS